jgi:hypothetical protein
MTASEAWDLLLKAAGFFGGIGIVRVGLAGFFAKFMADKSIEKHKATLGQQTERLKSELTKEAETYKLQLRKQELIFDKQLDAVSAFIELHQKIMPRRQYPDMFWSDVQEDVIKAFGKSETRLEDYRREFAAVLDGESRDTIRKCIELASNNKFAGRPESNVSVREAETAADDFLEMLGELENHLLEQVRPNFNTIKIESF